MDNTDYINQLKCKVNILVSKAENYHKQIVVLEDKLAFYEKDTAVKEIKSTEQLNLITTLEKENISLKHINLKNNSEKNGLISTSSSHQDEYKTEILNLQSKIEDLDIKNKQISDELIQKTKEADLYNKDNSVLISKIKEIEEQNKNLKCDSNNINSDFNNYKSLIEEDFNAQLMQYTDMINNEIKIIAQFIDTYITDNTEDVIVPNIFDITNLPSDHCLMFNMLKHSVENSRKRIFNCILKNENCISELQREIANCNKVVEDKINEINQLKNENNKIKEKCFLIQDEYEKLYSEYTQSKILNRKLQESFGSFNENYNKYFDSIYMTIKNELDNILFDNDLQCYNEIIIGNEGVNEVKDVIGENDNRAKFEDSLEKLISLTHMFAEDVKKSNNNYMNRLEFNDVNELNLKIIKLKEQVINYEKELSLAKEEKKLFMSQIELLENSNM